MKFKKVTYLGKRAEVATVGINGGTKNVKTGERVVVIHWLDDADEKNGGHPAGTVVVRHCTGDGRYPAEFTIFSNEVFSDFDSAIAHVNSIVKTEVSA